MLVCSLVARMGAGAHALEKVAVLRLCVAFILHPQLLTPAPKHSYDCGQESHTSFWLSSSFFKLSISDPSSGSSRGEGQVRKKGKLAGATRGPAA